MEYFLIESVKTWQVDAFYKDKSNRQTPPTCLQLSVQSIVAV